MLKTLQKLLVVVLLVVLSAFLLYQGFLYSRARDKMPVGMTVAGIDVAGLTLEEVDKRISEQYLGPVKLKHRDESVEMNPADVGFLLDMETMLREAELQSAPENAWFGFAEFVLGQTFDPVAIDLYATHDRAVLMEHLTLLASFMDKPATGPRLMQETESYEMGQNGYVMDVGESLPLVEEVLYKPEDREVQLVIIDQEAKPFDMDMLQESIQQQIQAFTGLGSFFISCFVVAFGFSIRNLAASMVSPKL